MQLEKASLVENLSNLLLTLDSSAIDICKYLFFVLCILLIISGIEINPRPSVASESSSSVSGAESLLSNMSNLMTPSRFYTLIFRVSSLNLIL